MSQFASALCDPTHRSSPVHLLHNHIKNSLSYLQTQLLTYDQCPLWYYESKSALLLPEHCVTGLIFWCMVTSVIFFLLNCNKEHYSSTMKCLFFCPCYVTFLHTNNDFSAGTNIKNSCLLYFNKHSYGGSYMPRLLSMNTAHRVQYTR